MAALTLSFVLTLIALLGWLYLAIMRGAFWRILLDTPAPEPDSWPSVDIIVPARNEADVLPQSLPTLLTQDYPGPWRVLLVDDHSADSTYGVAHRVAKETNKSDRLTVINAPDLPAGWSGKVATMHAGVQQSRSDYILFTDADIAHNDQSLRRLMARTLYDNLDLNSLMVKLQCSTFAEKLLIPAFVFFFAMLYPFRLANKATSTVAAAAGGVMLVKRKALQNIGGLARIKSALIDDCALARAIKDNGGNLGTQGRIRLSLTNNVHSLRRYPTIADVLRMISRTAFTQLRYSYLFLLGIVLGLGFLFFTPVLVPLWGSPTDSLVAYAALLVMVGIYAPMVCFYDLSVFWALTLPVAALLYIHASLVSAWNYTRGKGGQWKGRAQAS